MIYFTSDTHFWHNNVIKYCARPYASVEEMNEDLVKRWNEVVPPEATVFFLGDFSMTFLPVETFSFRLNGRKVLVPGNHDFCHSYHKKSRTLENREKWIQKYKDYGWEVWPEQHSITVDFIKYNLCHHPYADDQSGQGDKYSSWRPDDDGTVLLCGHVHEKWKTKRSPKGTLQINIGCDVWDYKPVSLKEVMELIEKENGKE